MPLIDRQFSAAGNFVQMDSIALQKQKKKQNISSPLCTGGAVSPFAGSWEEHVFNLPHYG